MGKPATVTKADKVDKQKPEKLNRVAMINELKALMNTDDNGIKNCIAALQEIGEVPQGKTAQMDDTTFTMMVAKIHDKYVPKGDA